MDKSREWTSRFFSSPANLPVSFVFDGKVVAGIPEEWKPSSKQRRKDAHIIETVVEGRDARTGLTLRVECTEYLDYPVVEWIAWLTAAGGEPTPIISDILAMDAVFEGSSAVLEHCNGDFCSETGYTPEESAIREGISLRFAPDGGRACDRAFPYYRVKFEGCGLTIAIGWPTQWAASFKGSAKGVHVQAGQEKTHLRLMPGETIRTPRMTVMSWTGDATRAVNLWRRWYRDHIMPKPGGQAMKPLLAVAATEEGEEFTGATQENQLRFIQQWAGRGIPFDVWWIDAGWYPCHDKKENRRIWWQVGNWRHDPERFPDGLKPISESAARHGADFLLWFEPERVWPGSQLDRECAKSLLKSTSRGDYLLNLGDPAGRQWLTDHICKLIKDYGVKIYRQDHNFAPLLFWRDNDATDRQGMHENLYVQGYLQFWDDLLARNPGLWIDSCASGGRRNDLETMRRSVPLHYSDYGYGIHPIKLAFHHILFQWMPYFKAVTLSSDLDAQAKSDQRVDSYSYHCALAPMFMPCIDIRRDDYDYEMMKKLLILWRRAAEMMLNGDYYPLTPNHRTTDKWVARQFDCPETGKGFIQGIRLPACPEETLVVHPAALPEDGVYRFENPETGETREATGRALRRDGFTFTLPKRQAAVWFYSAT